MKWLIFRGTGEGTKMSGCHYETDDARVVSISCHFVGNEDSLEVDAQWMT